MEKSKTIISVQLHDSMVEWLKKQAEEECISVSAVLRRLVVKAMREEKEEAE